MTDDHHAQTRSALDNLPLCLFVGGAIKPGHLVSGLQVVGEAFLAGLLEQANDKISRKVADKMKIF